MSSLAESKHAKMMALVYRGKTLPRSWTQVTVADIGEVVTGNTPPRSEVSHYGDYLPFVKPGDLEVSGFVQTAEEYLSEAGAEKARVIPANSVMVTCIASLGKTGISGRVVATNQQINSIIVSATVDPKYVYYFCLSSGFQEAIETGASATTVAILNKSKFSSLPIVLAPKGEQRRIVDEIETQFARLDTAVADLRRLQHNLDRYRASVLKAAFEGRLVPQDPADEPAEQLLQRILAERRRRWEAQEWQKHVERARKKVAQARRKAAGRPARLSDLEPEEWQDVPGEEYRTYLPKGEKWKEKYEEPRSPNGNDKPDLPAGWCSATVDQVSLMDVGFGFKSEQFSASGIRLLRGENIEPGSLRWTDTRYWPREQLKEFEHLLVETGEIILAMDRPIISSGLKIARAKESDLPALLVQRMTRFRPVEKGLTPYLYHILSAQDFINHLLGSQTGTQLPHISKTQIGAYEIPLPPLEEQRTLTEELDRHMTTIGVVEGQIETGLARVERLRQAILEKAFTGRLVPQDPGDEPAEKLLERIRAARNRDRSQQLSLFHEESS